MEHHAAGLSRLIDADRHPDLVDQLIANYQSAELTPRERALLDYAAKLTLTPGKMVKTDLDPMRATGLSDEAILDANLTVAYFAYVNRVADGLGVPLDDYMQANK